MKIWIVDAFTQKPFFGNPAGVCILHDLTQNHSTHQYQNDAKSNYFNFPKDKIDLRHYNTINISDQLMQSIAAEFGLSEIAFVRKIHDKKYNIRWFTPNSEAPICGHATISALHILIQEGYESEDVEIEFITVSGPISAIKDSKEQLITLNFPRYDIHKIEYPENFSNIINIHPIESYTDHNCIIMKFETPYDIANLKPNLALLSQEPYRALIATSKAQPMFQEYDFVLRYFAPKVGINEDPVCASAHCRLTPYWAKVLQKDKLISYQLSQRSGVIFSQTLESRVLISGHAVTILSGVLSI